MANNRLYAQAQKFTLAVGISTSDTSITLTSFNFPDGSAITSSDIGSVQYGTLEPGTTREESISFTGFTTNADTTVTLTGVTRGLGFGASDSYAEQSDLKVQHGAGATLILSNTAAFYNDFVNKHNDETMTGFLSVPTPTSDTHAATKAYVDAAALGGATIDNVIVAGTAGESVAAGDIVYFRHGGFNRWRKADADTVATINGVMLGIAQGSGSANTSITGGVLIQGRDSNQSGLTAGNRVYISNTAGSASTTAGTNTRVIGFATGQTHMYFNPSFFTLPTANEKDALAGGGDIGTPTSSNKFISENYITTKNITRGAITRTYTANGTWTKPTGLKMLFVQVWGGGASGGVLHFDERRSADGGGGGAYDEGWFRGEDLGTRITVTVGAGGAAGTVTGPANSNFLTASGNNGGQSSFGNLITAVGGSGSSGGVATYSRTFFNGGNGVSNTANTAGNTLIGGAGGGGYRNISGSGVVRAGGRSRDGGNGGDGLYISGVTAGTHSAPNGSTPGGGGGGLHTRDGNNLGTITLNSGAGARGEVRVLEIY